MKTLKVLLKLEVIAEDTYFTPWESNFEVDTAKKVQVEVKSQQGNIIKEGKPSIKVKNINEVTLNEKKPCFKHFAPFN